MNMNFTLTDQWSDNQVKPLPYAVALPGNQSEHTLTRGNMP
jgi:hypothetical protein